jgi:predicted ATPase/class 3 adenylate cyclase
MVDFVIQTMTDPASPLLTLRLFGPFDARLDGEPLPRLRSLKGQWLLALLILRHGVDVERSWLAGMLWPNSPESPALANLRNSLTDLRRALGTAAVRLCSPTPHTLRLELTAAEADVIAFDAALAGGDVTALEAAIALYRGPLLEGCTEAWAFQEREAREQAYLAALERLADAAIRQGEHATAERHLRRAVTADPTRESAQRALMETLAASGNYAAAIQTYRDLRLHLHRELNAEPDAQTRAVFESIRTEARARAGGRGREGERERGRDDQGPSSKGAPVASVTPSLPLSLSPSAAHPLAPSAARAAVAKEDTLTFLFTDIEGSTRLWEEQPDAMRLALARHDVLLRGAIETNHGQVFKTVGDAFYAAFVTATDAVDAALAAQRNFLQAPRPTSQAQLDLRVRMALHTGAVEMRGEDYFGPAMNRVARLLSVAHGGQVLLSAATQELVQDDLPPGGTLRSLGQHRLRDLQRPEPIFQLLHPDLPADFPPLASLDTLPHNLPQQVTSFIGREREMADVQALLESARLLTLTGPGGTGKTRLALQAAEELLAESGTGAQPLDGIWFIDLAPLTEPSLVPQATAAVLGIREEHGVPLTQVLAASLKPKRLLLVLDNCEHLLSACAHLADALLRACPGVRILATSREGLGIAGEQTYAVPTLPVPDGVCLFVERAVSHNPGFRVTDQNAPIVAQVCHRLDGIPLAIELAAARIRALPIETIATRLDDRFRLLTGGSRTALPRQQTLRALIDWSYDLLSEPERILLRRLAVFAGGWTLEAAEAVCAAPEGRRQKAEGSPGHEEGRRQKAEGSPDAPPLPSAFCLLPSDVLDLLTALLEKSLVLYEEGDGEARYRLLETVRQYGWERLGESGEEQAVRGAHFRLFLSWVEEGVQEFMAGRSHAVWQARVAAEHENLRAAMEWCLANHPGETALRMVTAVYWFWQVRGRWSELRACLDTALARDSGPLTAARARALGQLGYLAYFQHEHGLSRASLQQSITLCRQMDDALGLSLGLNLLAAVMCWQGEHEPARPLVEEALALGRRQGNQWIVAFAVTIAALVEYCAAEYARSAALFEESIALCRELGEHSIRSAALVRFGDVRQRQGLPAEAKARYQEALASARMVGYRLYIARSFIGLAEIALAEGDAARSARLLGQVQFLCDALQVPLPRYQIADYERDIAGTRAALGEEGFAAAWEEGRTMTTEEAMCYAMADDEAG